MIKDQFLRHCHVHLILDERLALRHGRIEALAEGTVVGQLRVSEEK
jgi:hypothetical protein